MTTLQCKNAESDLIPRHYDRKAGEDRAKQVRRCYQHPEGSPHFSASGARMNSKRRARSGALVMEAVAYGGVEVDALRGGGKKLLEGLLGDFEVAIERSANEGDLQNAAGC